MDRIPYEVEVAVRAAGDDAGGYAGELSNVYRRARRRSTRRAAAAASVVAMVLGLAGAGYAARVRGPHLQPAVVVTPSVPVEPAQRLILNGASGQYVSALGGPRPLSLSDRQVAELTADGYLATAGGGLGPGRVVGRPGGPVVELHQPGAGREMTLTVSDPGGIARDVGPAPVSLVASTADTAYLWRPGGLFAHDLISGRERVVITSLMLELPATGPAAALDASDVVGDRLVIARRSRSCRPLLLDIAQPQGLRFLPLTALGCRKVTALRLSPSTGRVAVGYQRSPGEPRVAVLGTEDGSVLADVPVVPARGEIALAWSDERTLRGVVIPVGPGVQVLRPFTVTS